MYIHIVYISISRMAAFEPPFRRIMRALENSGYGIIDANAAACAQPRRGYLFRVQEYGTRRTAYAKVRVPADRDRALYEIQAHKVLPSSYAKLYALDVLRVQTAQGEWIILITNTVGEQDVFTYLTSPSINLERSHNPRTIRNDVLQLARDVSTQLVQCHAKMLLHGDIKPENVVVNDANKDTDELRFILIDFEAAQVIDTHRRDTGGTACYADVTTLDSKVKEHALSGDVWQLGIIMALFLLDTPLQEFERRDSAKQVRKTEWDPRYEMHRAIEHAFASPEHGLLPALEQTCDTMGVPGLYPLLYRMLSPNPNERPSASEIEEFTECEIFARERGTRAERESQLC